MKSIKIAPSILSCNFGHLADEIKKTEEAGADLLHLDIMDGHFVPNLTMGPAIVKTVRSLTNLPIDVHLMIENPNQFINDYIEAGADIIIIHAETSKKLRHDLQHIKSRGKLAGVAVNPATPISKIEGVLDIVDLVLIMSVNPGFSGQKFMPEVLPKIRDLRKKFSREIMIDGGINDKTAKEAMAEGADILVTASYYFSSGDYKKAIHKLRQ